MEILDMLPHKPPFRFIDNVINYQPNEGLKSSFYPGEIRAKIQTECVPESILIEGLAQSAVLFTQLETAPLQDDEVPVLGSVDFSITNETQWNESVLYNIKPIRLLDKQAIVEGEVQSGDNISIKATLSIAVKKDG